MIVQLFFFGLSLLLRGEGVLLRRKDVAFGMRLLGWFLCMAGWWSMLVGFGAFARLWPIFPAAIIGAVLHHRWHDGAQEYAVLIGVDLVMVMATGLLALPPLAFVELIGIAFLLALVGLIIELAARFTTQRISWLWLSGLGVVVLFALVVFPVTRGTMVRIFESRFLYLVPEVLVADVTPFPTPRPTLTPSPTVAVVETVEVSPTIVVTPVPEESTMTPVETPVGEETAVPSPKTIGQQWTPYLEWEYPNPSYQGNPFDLAASATFTHAESGETISTNLFYAGDDTWHLRFTGTLPGIWSFETISNDPELDGHQDVVQIEHNPGVAGFVTQYENKWGRTGIDRAFVPQYLMIGGPQTYYQNPGELDYIRQTFMVEHGFNGVHTLVFCRWFDIEQKQCSRVNVADPNPDLRTFEALEDLITMVHANGGVVHIWMWGDDSRSENQKRWGINSEADKRLQRYIAARLGPLPGWTMGYGYDLYEWATGDELTEWHDYMQAHLGWSHYLGGRSQPDPAISQLSEELDYSAYEQLEPTYDDFVAAFDDRPYKPSFSEDRFRIQEDSRYENRNWSMDEVRLALWHSTLAGGVANIWGNISIDKGANGGESISEPFPNPEQVKTYALFFENRFWVDMVRCNELTDGYCLMRPTNAHYVFYAEDADSVQMDLTGMLEGETAVAIDTRLAYEEISLGELNPEDQIWTAPYQSDWAIAVGEFPRNP
ncbi:MAG: DUF5060 domain-containing protein [Chloroflexi bacterium]|nr:MAG: DUF5060 domain-containing protein [Chloroflexota bacterium]